jgi:tetraether lipid synthase
MSARVYFYASEKRAIECGAGDYKQEDPALSTQTIPSSPKPAFAPGRRASFKVQQPQTTYTGSPITPIEKGLPRKTQSLCPECSQLIDATLLEENGRVYMEKTCAAHGSFRDLISPDAELYLKMENWHFGDNRGVKNPAIAKATRCPEQCGLCSMHTSHTVLANVDLTNRCNLTCPVCFANANVQGYLYEPDIDHVRRMLEALRKEDPVAGRIVQFSGGEPTIHPQFLEICAMARDMGFSHIQAATNGILLADAEFARRAKANGLTTLYLQFDGVSDEVYRCTRGAPLLETKLRCIESCRQNGIKIVFVPTIVRGVNDDQIGDIVRTAIDNIDCVSGISFQPVAFTGRINRNELEAKRFTLGDWAHAMADQTGILDARHDFFPLSCVAPFSRLGSAMRGEEIPTLTCNPHCSMGTYLFIDQQTGTAVPVTRFVDVGAMLQDMDEYSRSTQRSIVKIFTKVKAWRSLQRHFKPQFAPPGLTFEKFLQTLQGMTDKKLGRDGMDGRYTYRTLLVAGMHFMDLYNYDIARVKRCVIHYAAPNGLIYPFCAYNSGPTFREKIEKKYSVPLEKPLHQMKCQPESCGGCGTAD